MHKRFLCALVCVFLLPLFFGISSFAEDAAPCADIIIGSVQGVPGTTVRVDVFIQNNPGLAAFRFLLEYDSDVLLPVNVQKGDVLVYGSLYSNIRSASNDPLVVNWDYPTNMTQDGTLFSVEFLIDLDASAGEYPLELSYRQADVCNDQFGDVFLTCGPSAVQVICPGDANEDGKIDLMDVVVITRWLAGGWNVTINEEKADVNKDGEIDLKDVVLIRRFLAGGWGVVLR